MLKKILVALDGSAPSGKALDLAADLAEKYGASLHLVHVLQGRPAYIETSRLAEAATEKQLRDAADELLSQNEQRARKRQVQLIEKTIGEGDPARTIVDLAEERGTDAIVLGTRGLGSLQGLLLGSVAHKVLHLARCAVITTR
jgi:nucleotide-binding universal stress UspA family protein